MTSKLDLPNTQCPFHLKFTDLKQDEKTKTHRFIFPSDLRVVIDRDEFFLDRKTISKIPKLMQKIETKDISEIKSEIFFELMTFLYMQQHEWSINYYTPKSEHCVQLVALARKYDIPGLKELCEKFMITEVNTNNVFNFLMFAEVNKLPNLLDECFETIPNTAILEDHLPIIEKLERQSHMKIIKMLYIRNCELTEEKNMLITKYENLNKAVKKRVHEDEIFAKSVTEKKQRVSRTLDFAPTTSATSSTMFSTTQSISSGVFGSPVAASAIHKSSNGFGSDQFIPSPFSAFQQFPASNGSGSSAPIKVD